MDNVDDKTNINETNTEFPYNSQDEGVCDVMIDVISE